MPGFSKETAPQVEHHGPVVDRHGEVLDYTINFVRFEPEMDGAPLLKGLPGDKCISPHWGYVLSGRMTYKFDDHDEAYEAGDAFFVPPGHTPLNSPHTEILQFSPTELLAIVSETLMRNFRAMQAGSPT